MLSNYKVQIVRENEQVQIRVENLGVFFVFTPTADILDGEGKIRAKIFFLIVRHTYRDFFEGVARQNPGVPFDVVTYHEPDRNPKLNSQEMAQMTNQLIHNLWADGHLNGHGLVISMGSLRTKHSSKGHNLLVGFTFRSSEPVIYLLEGENCVRGI